MIFDAPETVADCDPSDLVCARLVEVVRDLSEHGCCIFLAQGYGHASAWVFLAPERPEKGMMRKRSHGGVELSEEYRSGCGR